MSSIFEYFNMMKKDGITTIFNITFSAETIGNYAEIIEKHIPCDEMPPDVPGAIFSVFIEQVTNVLMYSERESRYSGKYGKVVDAPMGVFTIGENEKSYFSQTCNVIKDEYVEFIRESIDHLNTLNKQELREYFKEQRRSENTNPISKGAGLGFIEIAKRASAPIEYSFKPLEEEQVLFSMLVTIDK